jgi:hypothetical protein
MFTNSNNVWDTYFNAFGRIRFEHSEAKATWRNQPQINRSNPSLPPPKIIPNEDRSIVGSKVALERGVVVTRTVFYT